MSTDDTLYILNFWATWCRPCIEELPFFENCRQEFKDEPVRIILVNLDFNNQVETQVIPFIKKKNIASSVWHITDTDADSWINKVDKSWSGAIPATVMYKNGIKLFFKEGQMSQEELKSTLLLHLKK